jgi:hypothetical protein
MNVIIWSLVLTVCAPNGQCFNQTVQWFDKENECRRYKEIYEEIPKDGAWASVEYKCGIVGAMEI